MIGTGSTFSEKIAFLAEQGACAAIISNNRSGPELFAMGGCETASPVPACLISKEHGIMLKSYLAEGNVVVLEFGRHPAVEGAKPMATQLNEYRDTPGAFDTPLSCKYGPDLRYVTRTLPVQFVDKSGDGSCPNRRRRTRSRCSACRRLVA